MFGSLSFQNVVPVTAVIMKSSLTVSVGNSGFEHQTEENIKLR
jgi:hypothetical protein